MGNIVHLFILKLVLVQEMILPFSKLVDGFITDPIPNEKSKPASDDINSDYPYLIECRNNPMCRTTQKVRRMLEQEKPNKDKFFDKKLDGEYSSSFYFKVGSCASFSVSFFILFLCCFVNNYIFKTYVFFSVYFKFIIFRSHVFF